MPAAIASAIVPDRRGGAALAVAAVGLLGVLSALVFDPRATGCTECPAQPAARPGDAGCTTPAAGGALAGGRGVRLASSARPLYGCCGPARAAAPPGPATLAVVIYLGAVAIAIRARDPAGLLSADRVDRALWTLQGAALLVRPSASRLRAGARAPRPRPTRAARSSTWRPGPSLAACATSSPACCAIPTCDSPTRSRRAPPGRGRPAGLTRRRAGGDPTVRRRAHAGRARARTRTARRSRCASPRSHPPRG